MYKNAIKYNNGIHLNGMTPLDDRLFLDSRSDVFVDPANLKSAKLYNRAYNGMVVGVHEDDGTVTVMSLNNVAPYKPDNTPDNTNLTVDETNYKTYWTVLGADIYDKIINATYFNPTKISDDSSTFDDHGNLKKGKTVADLKQMTVSDILKNILFEVIKATPYKEKNVSISWSGYQTVLEVGSVMPAINNIILQTENTKWKLTTSAGKDIRYFDINKFSDADYMCLGQSESYSAGISMSNATYGTSYQSGVPYGKTNFQVRANFKAYEDAVDTDGNISLAKVDDSAYSNILTITGAYRVFSNAAMSWDNMNTAWSNRSTEVTNWVPGDIKPSYLLNGKTVIYFKWPNNVSDNFYIYIPSGSSLSIKAANNTTPVYDLSTTCTKSGSGMSINTTVGGQQYIYDTYLIEHAVGYTNICAVIE